MRSVVSLLKVLLGSVRDLAPIVLVIVFFQLFVLRQPFPDIGDLGAGLLFLLVGLTFFVRGLEMGLFPLGESMAFDFAKKGSLLSILAFSFALGFSTTVAEPALIAVAAEAASAAANAGLLTTDEAAMAAYALGLRLTVALAVGIALIIGVMRIIANWSLPLLIIGGYCLVVLLTMIAPEEIIGVAYDSGGVTTSTVTVPLVTAVGIGLAGSIKGRNPMTDGFGLIAFASLTPILFVLAFGIISSWT